jgi:AAA domain-containing protein
MTYQLADWQKILAAVPADKRLAIFTKACFDAGRHVGDTDKASLIDNLVEVAVCHSFFGLSESQVEGIIGTEFKRAANEREDSADRERLYREADEKAKRASTKGNGKAQHDAAPTDAKALSTMTFPPIKYVVPGIIIEGLTLVAGKPKVGKSWLALHAAVAVARGGFTLGETHCIEGDALYCALEDNLRRLQSRMTKLLGMPPWNVDRLDFYTELPRLAEGGLATLEDWIKSKPHPRLIVIDVLAMVRPQKKKDQTNYDADYAAVLQLRQLANKYGIAIVAICHLRKADADDAFDTVSGTLGLTGAPDTILILKRDASGGFVLHGRGRDLIEIEKAMEFDADTCIWRIIGEASAVRRTSERNTILYAIKEATEPLSPSDVAAATDMKVANVKFLLRKLLEEGAIERVGHGKYQVQKAAFQLWPVTAMESAK